MKKIIFVFIACLLTFNASAISFTDVPSNALELTAIDRLFKEGIINGYSDGTFRGTNKVTRAELAKIFLVAANIPVRTNSSTVLFNDVLPDAWFYDYVYTAASAGIVDGYPHGDFIPMAEVNTAEFLKMLTKTFKIPRNQPHSYTDVNTVDWFDQYVGVAQAENFFPLRTPSLLEPARSMTRYEVVYALYQMLFTDENLSDVTAQSFSQDAAQIDRQSLSNIASNTQCSVESSQLCVEDKTLFQERIINAGMVDVEVAQYKIFSPESNSRFASFEVLTNANPNNYPVFWLEQNDQRITPKTSINGARIEFTMDRRLELGNNKSLILMADIPTDMSTNDFLKLKLLYLDNVWQNQTGDIGQMAKFGSKLLVK